MWNNNGSIIRRITRRTLGANKKRNFFLASAIVLTAFMMAAVFSVGISFLETVNINRFRLEGNVAHMGLPALTPEQFEKLHSLDYVRDIGAMALVGNAYLPGGEVSIPMFYVNEHTWDTLLAPAFTNIVGRFANNGVMSNVYSQGPLSVGIGRTTQNEIMLSCSKLAEMGIENPYIGMRIPLDFAVHGSEEILTAYFTLSLIYTEYVSVMAGGGTPIFISHDFAAQHGGGERGNWLVTFRSQGRAYEYAHQLVQDLGLVLEFPLHFYLHPAISFGTGFNPVPLYIGMGTLIVLLMITGFLLIYNVMYVSVSKDVRFYGVLKTLGTTPRQLRRIVNGQVLWLYLIGLPIGLLLAAVASFLIIPMVVAGDTGYVISFSPVIYVGGALFTLLTVYLGALTSARKAAQVSPIEAVKYTGESTANLKVRSSAKGKPQRMAIRNIFREKRRTFVVLTSLFLGLTVFTIVMTFVNSMDDDHAAQMLVAHDFMLASREFDGFPPHLMDDIASIPHVTEVRPDFLTVGWMAYDERIREYVALHIENDPWGGARPYEIIMETGMTFDVRGLDMAWLMEWNEQQENPLSNAEIEAFNRGELLLIDTIGLIFGFGLETEYEMQQVFPLGTMLDIKLGYDELDVRMPARAAVGGFAQFPIGPFTWSMGNARVALYMSADYLQGLLGDGLRLMHMNINVADGRDETVYEALHETVTQEHLMRSRLEARRQLAQERQTIFLLGTGLSAILGIIGIFNFINVISVGLLVRKREFATLESVGMSKHQMRAMLRWEGAIYWLVTIGASLTIGNALAYGIFTLASGAGYFTGFTYPLIPIAIAYTLIIVVCTITPKIAYNSINKLTLVERLREAE